MALKKLTLEQISRLLKIKETDLEAAIKDEKEVDLVIDDKLQVFTEAELVTRDKNRYGEGRAAGEEMIVKAIKQNNSLEFDGYDTAKLVEAIAKKAVKEAGVNPDERIAEKDKVIEQLRKKTRESEEAIAALKAEKEQITLDGELRGYFPQNKSAIMTDDEYLSLIKTNYKFETRDGKKVAVNSSTGEVVIDPKLVEPLPLKTVIENHFSGRKWIEEKQNGGGQNGRGAGNSSPAKAGGFQKLSEIRKYAADNDININGEKFQALAAQARKENPQLIID